MNKTEFIDIMEKSLLRLPKSDRDDIISDFEAHFAIGTEKGISEEDVAASLGDPRELAETYLESLPEGSKGAPAYTESAPEEKSEPAPEAAGFVAPDYSSASGSAPSGTDVRSKPDAGSIVGVVFLSIAALFVLFILGRIWFALAAGAFGVAAAAVALPAAAFALFSENALLCVGSVLFAVSLAALAGLLVVAAIAGLKGIIALVKIFIGFCKKLLNGGNN